MLTLIKRRRPPPADEASPPQGLAYISPELLNQWLKSAKLDQALKGIDPKPLPAAPVFSSGDAWIVQNYKDSVFGVTITPNVKTHTPYTLTTPQLAKAFQYITSPQPYRPLIIERDERDKLERGALEWVNAIRTEFGLGAALSRLPKGLRSNSQECPMARALGHDAKISSGGAHLTIGENIIPISIAAVCPFISAFDSGLLPHLVDPLPARTG